MNTYTVMTMETQIFNEIDKISLFQKWRIAITLMDSFHTLYRLSDGKLSIRKLIELPHQFQLFNKKIISAYFKTRGNAFIMRQKPAWCNVYYPKVLTGHLHFIDFLQTHKQSYNSTYIPK